MSARRIVEKKDEWSTATSRTDKSGRKKRKDRLPSCQRRKPLFSFLFFLLSQKSIFLLSLFASHLSPLSAQCPLTVNAGPDLTACAPSGPATLQGSITGTPLGFNWEPALGLSDPFSLTPTATVTGTQTYTLTASAFDPSAPNLVSNPAFELGSTGYTSQLVEDPLPVNPGTYILTTSPALVNSNFPPCDDHTFGNGTGFMFLGNGPAVAGTQVWCQTIPVMPNTWYSMSAWTTVSPISPPQFQFSVNGQLIGTPFLPGTTPCNWQQFSGAWFSGTATSADFCIIDQNGSGNGLFGDDFALDDIYFGEACSVSDDMTVSLVDVMAVLDPTVELPCSALPAGMMLDGSASTSGPNVTYQWTTGDGNIVSGANTAMPTINMEGTYTLTVTYDDGVAFCTDQASVQVLPDPNIVFAFVAPPEEVNCLNPTVTLDASASSSGPTISYSWSPAANILAGAGTQFPEVNMGGGYTLTVSNSISGCTATETVFVFENFNFPTVGLVEPEGLTCADSLVTLSGNGSSVGSEFTYEWTTTDGHIVSGSTTLDDCVVDSSGTYTLTVTNTQNGCTADTIALVMSDVALPNAVASAPTPIGCGGGSVSLSGSGSSSGSSFEYFWETTNGNILSGETTLSPTVDVSAEYLLTVTNLDNGCTASDTTFLSENTASLMAEIAEPDTLDCVLLSQNLDATSSTLTPDVSISWMGPSGALSDTTLSPEINVPGTYTLTLTDNPTGCTSTASVEVFENVTLPTAEAGPAMTIDCDADPVILMGNGNGDEFSWITLGGNILSGEATLSPEVNAAGVYFLTVTENSNGCTAVDSVAVNQTGDAPTVSLMVDGILDCQNDTLTIDGSGSTSNPQIIIEWTFSPPSGGPGGALPFTSLSPNVSEAGTYTLTLTDQSTGCVGSGSIEVEIDTVPPVAVLAAPFELSCDSLTVHLDGTASSSTGFFATNWQFLGGSGGIVGGANGLTPEVNLPGEYVLTVVDWENGCSASDTVSVGQNVDEPTAEAGAPQTLDCDLTSLDLSGNGSSSGTGFEYLWTTSNGNILSGETTLSPTIDEPGIYVLTVENTANGCTAADSVTIDESADLPTANIEAADSLDCANASVFLSGNGSSSGVNFTYLWTTMDGNFAAGETTLTPEVDAPGTYLLTVTDTSNNCVATEQIEVFQNGDLPTAEAGLPFTLSCLVPEAILSGSGSSSGSQFDYLWTTSNGNILSGETTLSPTINAPGTYTLTVTDTSNGCTSTDEVTIDQDADAPVADAGLPDTLTCLVDLLTLDGTGSSMGANFSFEWTTTDGNFAGGQSTLTPEVDEPGTYLLTVTDQTNDCESIASVTIFEDVEIPNAEVAMPLFIDCDHPEVTLNGTGSSSGVDYIFEWTTTGGNFAGGQNTLTPSVNAGGEYVLVVIDIGSGCTSSDMVVVFVDTFPPVAVANAPAVLGCSNNTVEINGIGSSAGVENFFLWWTDDGNIVSGFTQLTATVDAPGTYTLTVLDGLNGCTAIDSVVVISNGDAPTAQVEPPSELTCADTLAALDGSGSSSGPDLDFSWQTPDGNFAAGQSTLTPEVDEPGTYFLVVENLLTGCADTASVIVSQNIDPPGADAGADQWLTCDLPEASLLGNSPTLNVVFEWQTTDGNFISPTDVPTAIVDAAGLYSLTVTDPENGCISIDEVPVTDVRLVDFEFEKTDADCVGGQGSVTFGNVNGGLGWVEFSVDGGTTFSDVLVYENLPTGTYELVVQDSGGCLISEFVIIENVAGVEVSLPQNVELELGQNFQLNPILNVPESEIAEVVWSPVEGLSCGDCLSPLVTPSEGAGYLLTLTDVNGCTASASVSFILVSPNGGVYVPNVFSPNGDGLNDVFLPFSAPNLVERVERFLVFTRWGESVFENYDFPPNEVEHGWDGTHRGEELNGGVYAWFAEVLLVNGERIFLEGEINLVK